MVDDTFYGAFMGSKHSNTHYFRSLNRVVQTIGAHGKSIVVGRGGNYIIKSQAALRVRIVRTVKERVSYVMELEGTSESNARNLINTRDTDRDDFIQHYFKRDSKNCSDYDLVLNAGTFSTNQLADLVLFAYEKKVGKSVPPIH